MSDYKYFELAPRNPNINGIYYGEDSYHEALKEFFSVNQPLYDRYDNDTANYKSNSHCVVGIISEYIDDNKIKVKIDKQLRFITPEDYVIGFKLQTKGKPHISAVGTKTYSIDKILYATLINKEFLQNNG